MENKSNRSKELETVVREQREIKREEIPEENKTKEMETMPSVPQHPIFLGIGGMAPFDPIWISHWVR